MEEESIDEKESLPHNTSLLNLQKPMVEEEPSRKHSHSTFLKVNKVTMK
jgi:hypothetical protein